LSVNQSKRKDISYKKEMLAKSDVTFLCLPDEISVETVQIADELGDESPIIIDASTAHRTNPNWSYGLPELGENYRKNIEKSKRIASPGCYSTGANVILKPLISHGILSQDLPIIINAVSGYSGGGKSMINYFQERNHEPFFNYGLKLNHKHLPEIIYHNKLKKIPIFSPSVGDFIQGMIVSIPLHFSWFNDTINTEIIQCLMEEFYSDSNFIKVLKKNEGISDKGYFRPDNLVGTNCLDISIFGNNDNDQLIISSRLDNLGKGASGAAIQSMNIALGLDETLGL
jgi:N-acetyl-gamma-glutamyl-phosphate reductase